MTGYELLEELAYRHGLNVVSARLLYSDGMIVGKDIGIRKDIETQAERADVLAEEIAHSQLTVGNILDQGKTENRKQEHKARRLAYDMRVGLEGIVHALEYGCQTPYEAAEYLGVTEKFFLEALDYYHQKYGECVTVGNYILVFEPTLYYIDTGE